MIFVQRFAPPKFYHSAGFRKMQTRLIDFFTSEELVSSQKSFQFDNRFGNEVRPYLQAIFAGKCAFCESTVSTTGGGSVERFRPKGGAYGYDDLFYVHHYWWLAYSWNNLLLVCNNCSRFKGSTFPVFGYRSEFNSFDIDFVDEQPILLDPTVDNPSEHLLFSDDGVVAPVSQRGEVTIEILKLNRAELVESRRRAVHELSLILPFQKSISTKYSASKRFQFVGLEIVREILSESSPRPYLEAQRQYVRRSLQQSKIWRHHFEGAFTKEELSRLSLQLYSPADADTGLSKNYVVVNNEDDHISESFRKIFIDRVELKNFKIIRDLTLQFPKSASTSENETEPWLVLLGENGVGKSTILKAIALTIAGGDYLSENHISDDDYISDNPEAKEGHVKIYLVGEKEPIQITFVKGQRKIESSHRRPATNLLAYGAIRLHPQKVLGSEHGQDGIKIMNLFDPSVTITDIGSWLRELHEQGKESNNKKVLFAMTAIALKDLLGYEENAILTVIDDEPAFELGKRYVKLKDLSDGYRTISYLGLDIIRALSEKGGSMDTIEGVVLIDEIGAHLHPRWKMRIIGSFRKCFPKVCFIVTTHDPLCLRGIREGEVVVLNEGPKNAIEVITNLPDPSKLNVEQLLKSNFFGLNSTLDPKDEDILNEYYLLASKKVRSQKDNVRMEELEPQVRSLHNLGAGPFDQIMFKTIQGYLNRMENVPIPDKPVDLSEEIIDQINALSLKKKRK